MTRPRERDRLRWGFDRHPSMNFGLASEFLHTVNGDLAKSATPIRTEERVFGVDSDPFQKERRKRELDRGRYGVRY